jgi:hypothetical protein
MTQPVSYSVRYTFPARSAGSAMRERVGLLLINLGTPMPLAEVCRLDLA